MVIPRLSPETERRLDAIFPSSLRAEASRLLLEECGNNLPGLATVAQIELSGRRCPPPGKQPASLSGPA
jgi:hypothetical protein